MILPWLGQRRKSKAQKEHARFAILQEMHDREAEFRALAKADRATIAAHENTIKALRLNRDALAERLESLTGERDALLTALDKARAERDEARRELVQVGAEAASFHKRLEQLSDSEIAKREAAVSLRELNMETEGPKRELEKENDAQAARAMSRNTKAAFVEYQKAVTFLLDRLNELGKKNHITKEDLRHFHDIRRDLSAQVQRTI